MKSERIGFSYWMLEDEEFAIAVWGDANVTRYLCAKGKFTEEEILQRLQLECHQQEQFKIQYWPIFTLDTCEFIGVCGLRPFAEEQHTLEIGIHLCEAFWGQGYAFEAGNLVIDYAFQSLDCTRIIAGHHPMNHASHHILEKLGFRYIGENYYEPTGLWHPSYEYIK